MRRKTITLWKLLVAISVLGITLGWLLTGYLTTRAAVDQGYVSATGVSGSRERDGRVAGDKDEPVYGGVPFTQILQNAVVRLVPHLPTPGKHDGGLIRDPEAEDAVRRTGTNGLPYLTQMIREGPQRHAELAVNAFRLLSATASPAIPTLEAVAQGATNGETIAQAIQALGYIGSNSLPSLERLSTNVNTRLGKVLLLVRSLRRS